MVTFFYDGKKEGHPQTAVKKSLRVCPKKGSRPLNVSETGLINPYENQLLR